MKAQSDTHPAEQIMSRGKTQVNYNVHEIEISDEQGTRTAWEYDYIEIEGNVTKAKVLAAMNDEERKDDTATWTPDETAAQHKEAKDAIDLSDIAEMTYVQLDTYIDNNVTNLAEAKAYLKKLSKVVLALVKRGER